MPQGLWWTRVVDAKVLIDCCARFCYESEHLRGELALWAEWLVNANNPWASIRVMMARRLIALDNETRV